jgi:hypothetical protein
MPLREQKKIIRRSRTMKRVLSIMLLVGIFACGVLSFSRAATAEELKMVGTITKIEMAADKKSATVILKDVKSGADVKVVVNDELTLDKFNDKRIVDGDEIRCKYDNESGKNISKIFKKTAGC